MPRSNGPLVNVVKKIKVQNRWIFCPAVHESSGRYLDRGRVGGRVETHHEGTYYLEWREEGRRRREAVPFDAQPQERARARELALESASLGVDTKQNSAPSPVSPEHPPEPAGASVPPDAGAAAAQQIMQGMGLYLQQLFGGTPPLPLTPSPAATSPQAATSVAGLTAAPHVLAPQHPIAAAMSWNRPSSLADSAATIADTIQSFLKDVEPPQREWKTYEEYRNVLHRFRDQCEKLYVREVNRADCMAFMRHLFSIGNEERTVYNRIGIVLHWLKQNGVTGLLHRGDKPSYVENRREIYEPEDLEALFRACTPDERVRYLFFLLTGERDKEVRYTAWPDIDFNRKCVWVTAKKQLHFKPKDKEERKIPVPASLLEVLKEYQSRQQGPNPHNLVFPTSEGKPDKKFENKLKRIARRAGLNCGHCISKYGNKCSEGPHCSKWFLHKFRHTFATNQLEEGVSIRRLQEWLGHSDIESTMVYLKYVDSEDIYEIVDNTSMAEFATQASLSRALPSRVA